MFVGMGANSGGGYNLESSLRFRSTASAYLSRTPASAGNRKTWTWSGWVKRGELSATNVYLLFGSRNAGTTPYTLFYFDDDEIKFNDSVSGTIASNSLYRDTSAWYHLICAVDTTQATSSNRVKIYVNGEQLTSFSTATYPSLNADLTVNSTYAHAIGAQPTPAQYFDGYMTEVNFVDGQALTPSDFGEYDTTTGVWKPKEYTGTYGTNGFYLDFSDSTSTTTLGYDQSSNSNNWTLNNISLTAGTTYDLMNDVATLTDEDTANFATLNPLDHFSTNVDFSDANLKYTVPAGSYSNGGVATSTITMTFGKWYCEMTALSAYSMIGIAKLPRANMRFLGDDVTGYAYYTNGSKYNGSGAVSYGASFTTNDVIGVALDLDAGTLTFYKNGVSQGTAFTGLSGEFVFATGNTNPSNTVITAVNFGQRPFTYTPPTGYKKLNTYNLPDSTIVDGSQYMNPVLWSGNGTSQSITGVGFEPDLVWTKERTSTSGNLWIDSVRGANIYLASNTTNAETVVTNAISSFDSDGFTVGNSGGWNQSGQTYVAWNWRASDSSAVSNTVGSITSTVSANTDSGFSIVTYTGSGNSSDNVGTGLSSSIPLSMAIVKRRDSTSEWQVGHIANEGSNFAYHLELNSTAANSGSGPYFMGGQSTSNGDRLYLASGALTSGATYVAYCFQEIEGFSKFGTYTGNGSADGPFIYTGFRPAFVMYKRTDDGTTGKDWVMMDTTRSTYNVIGTLLTANTSNTESYYGASSYYVDFLSNGWKHRASGSAGNASGAKYIYVAFAENPFKQSLAR